MFTAGLLSYCLGQGLVSTIAGIPSVYQHFLGVLHMKVNLIVNFNPMWDKNDFFFLPSFARTSTLSFNHPRPTGFGGII
jgi:hypothetical protein